MMKAAYRPFLDLALRFPKTVVAAAVLLATGAVGLALDFGSSFLPPFREDSFNVALSLPPGASLAESERIAEACVPELRTIPGVLSVTRRTGRAERDQHAEPVSSSEYVVRVDMNGDTDAVKAAIRERIGKIPGCSLLVGYPIAHRIDAVLSGTEAALAINVYGQDFAVLREVVARMKRELDATKDISDVRANREVTVRTLRIDYDEDLLLEAGLTLRSAGEQVAAAFNGVEVGEVRDGIRRRAVTVRLGEAADRADADTVKALVLSGRNGRRVRLDEVARIVPEEASNLMLREGGRRKALITCNAAEDADVGSLVGRLRERLAPIAAAAGCSVEFGGSYQARESAGRRLRTLGVLLVAAISLILVTALRSVRAAMLTLINVPLGLVGGVVAVAIADPVLSVPSLVGFITVSGFVIRNGLLLINRYQDRLAEDADLETAIRDGSLERMPPIIMTSLTTVFGLVPIILSGSKPGGELLAPLAIVQFGGLIGATALNLIVLPSAAKVFRLSRPVPRLVSPVSRPPLAVFFIAFILAGCRSYEPKPIDWEAEAAQGTTNSVRLATLDDAATVALVANPELNLLRLKAAGSDKVARETGWWDDPELDFDFLRIVNPHENPFLLGGSVAFTIPLSGVPDCEAEAARLYADADRDAIRAAELDVAADARKGAIRIISLRERANILRAYETDERIRRALASAERLSAAGEVSAGDLAAAKRRRHAHLHLLRGLERELIAEEASFCRLLGLRPETHLILPTTNLHAHHDVDLRCDDPLSLVRHPKVQEALRRLGGDEASLKAEIRRQYPDLKFGPAYEREDGLDRFGLVAGLTLPLWNRNRKGIAEAEATRDEARFTAIDVWRKLVTDAAAARRTLTVLLDHPHAPPTGRTNAETLADAGELGPLDYLSVREELVEFDLQESEWHHDVCLAWEEVQRFKIKNFKFQISNLKF